MKRTIMAGLLLASMATVSCTKDRFCLAGAEVIVSQDDFNTARKAAELLVSDMESVTGNVPAGKNKVIVGTIGKSVLIDSLVSAGVLDVSETEG